MKNGYTKTWRKELSSDIWMMPPVYHRVWYWLRQKVQYKPTLRPTPKGIGVWVLPGQRLTSLQEIAEGVKWTEWGKEIVPNKKTIKFVLDWLEKEGMIVVESNAKGTLISIVNWDTYNGNGVEESNAEETLTGSPMERGSDTNKKEKNLKEGKEKNKPPLPPKGEVEFSLPEWVPADEWNAFVAMRKSIKKPMTAHAMKLAVKKLEALKAEGHEPADVLNQSIFGSWQDLYAIKDKGATQPQGKAAYNPLKGIRA